MSMVLSEKELQELHDVLLDAMVQFDVVCKENGIQYFLGGGTLLGAIRHGGFIPWDDDIDIAMTRKDYEALKRLLRSGKKLLPENMELILPDEYRNGRAFYDFTPRIIYKNSRRHGDSREMDYYEGKLNHLWVDIFILDNIPDSPLLDRWVRFRQKVIYGLSMPKRWRLDLGKYSPSDRLKVSLLKGAGERLDQALEEISIQPIGLPYLSNVTADYVEDPAAVRGLLVRQVSSPVRWQQCVERMIADGADTFIEIGPGKSLSGFMRRIDKNVTVKNVEHVEDLEKL